MTGFIFFFVILIFAVSLFATNQTAAKPNKNMLLGVTLPYNTLKDENVMGIVKAYKKSHSVLMLLFLPLSLPLFVFASYPSFTIIYTFVWIIMLLYLNNRIYIKYFRSLYSLKRKNDWFLINKHVVSIDTEVSRIKNKMPISKLWFIPSFIAGIVPLAVTLAVKNSPSFIEIFPSLLTVLEILLFYYLYNLYSNGRIIVYSEKTEINLACNYIHKRLWSLCWVIIAALTGIIHLISYLSFNDAYNYSFPFLLSMYILVFLVCVFYTYDKIRNSQNRLLEASENIIYTDDDEYWKRGYYYNPGDKRTMVEKRIGYGFTCNMATLKGKLFTFGILVPAAALVLFLSVVFVRMDTASFKLFVKDNVARIDAPMYAFSFNVDDIQEVKKVDTIPKGARTNGAATQKYLLGNFNLNGYGKSKMYVYQENPPIIVVKLNGLYLFINGKTEEITETYYKLLMNSWDS